ncbi:hypothetical protein D3C76_1572420 [compost metagenome]
MIHFTPKQGLKIGFQREAFFVGTDTRKVHGAKEPTKTELTFFNAVLHGHKVFLDRQRQRKCAGNWLPEAVIELVKIPLQYWRTTEACFLHVE